MARDAESRRNASNAADKDRQRLDALEVRVDKLVQALRKGMNLDIEPGDETVEQELGLNR